MTGVLNINKPRGITSHDVVARVRKMLGEKRVGHAGTLDPAAQGVLLLLLGPATRLAEFAAEREKEYLFRVVFGLETDTLDSEGQVLRQELAGGISEDDVRQVLASLEGEIEMIPPMFSAVRHEGRKLYELARQGITVERKPRLVLVEKLRLEEFLRDDAHPEAVIRTVCSKGTYVRSLAQMIAERLGTVGTVSELVRTRVGSFRLEDALALEELEQRAKEGTVHEVLLPSDSAVAHLPRVELDPAHALALSSGQEGVAGDGEGLERGALVRVYVRGGEFFAIGTVVSVKRGELFVAPKKVLRDLRHKNPI